MNIESKKVKVIEFKPTHLLVRMQATGQKVKVSKRYFEKRVDCGVYEVVNKHDLPTVI